MITDPVARKQPKGYIGLFSISPVVPPSEETMKIVRPEIPRYFPEDEPGRPWLYNIGIVMLGILAFTFNLYIGYGLINVVLDAPGPVSMVLSAFVLFIEWLTGNYGLLVMWMFGRRFLPISKPEGYQGKFWDENVPVEELPFISILIPAYQESNRVLTRTLVAAKDLNYPDQKYDVTVTEDVPKNELSREITTKLNVNHLIREHRRGFKGGSINDALPQLKGDFVIFIDADHILEKNVIYNVLNAWRPTTIGVQTRLDFVNLHTILTYISMFIQLQFFSIMQFARRKTGTAVFAGGAGMFHRQMLLDNGGINELTIAEDTDSSFIFTARGYRIEYIDVIGAWGLMPWDPLSLVRQLWRWLNGITRSIRARWLLILRGKTPLYTKVDFLLTGLFATIGILGWMVAIPFALMVVFDVTWIHPSIQFGVFGAQLDLAQLLISVLALGPISVAVITFLNESKLVLFTRRPLLQQISSIISFYFLVISAQPLLIGGIVKGWLGTKVIFNRTPKEKKIKDKGLQARKIQYLVMSLALVVYGVVLLWIASLKNFVDPRLPTVLYTAVLSFVPILFVAVWYSQLEPYLDEVKDISAESFLKEGFQPVEEV